MKKLFFLMLLAVNVFTACKQRTDSLSIENLKGIFNSHSLLFSDEELPQTVDITGLTNTAYFEIETSKEGKNYKVKDVTSEYDK